MVTFNMSRSASYFESGIGRGMGFRNSNQDLLGFVHQIPERARKRIIDIASTQFENGGAYHQYQPLTKKGNHEVGGGFNDDPLWLIVGTSAYIKETGDFGILDEQVSFDGDMDRAAYSRYYINLGEISSYPPGYKENAGIFCHNNPWIMMAEAVIGRGDRAFELYSKIAPAYLEDISDIHRTEPYVYAQMIAGKDAIREGAAKNSWLTGTAAWNFIAITQSILGIQPDGMVCLLIRVSPNPGTSSQSPAFSVATPM